MIRRAGQILSLFVRLFYSIFFLCSAILSIYSICDLYYLYQSAAQKSGTTEHIGTQREENHRDKWPDGCVARICIDNTTIDYPLMQAKDNTTYLNLDENGNYSLSGSVFLDFRCSPQFDDGYSLIYGHHMEYGLMFGALDRFQEETYFDRHRKGTLTLRGGREIELTVFALVQVPSKCPEVFERPFEPETSGIMTEWIRQQSAVFREDTSKFTQIYALSTCSGERGGRREILFLCADSEITGSPENEIQ